MLKFAHPDILWYLVAVAAAGAALYAINRYRSRQFAKMVSRTLSGELAPDKSRSKRFLKQAIVLLALALLVLALANPQMGTRVEEIKREGIDLFVALDVSLSMKAEDIKPNRLEKAKRDVSNLLNKLAGDRVGLIVFAGDAYVQFPLTADYSAADLFISAVDVESVPRPGTMIGSAIEKALESFKAEDPTQKAIIIASDGENTEGDIKGAVEKALDAGVKVYAVGTGTPEGGPIPLYNAAGVRTDFKRDMGGKVVLTRLDETTLEQIASATGGSYRRATSGGDEIDEVFQELAALEKTEFGVKQITGYESLYQYPLGLALLLMFFEFMLSERRGRVIAKLKKLIPVAAMMLVMLGVPDRVFGQTVRAHVAEGNEAYAKGQYPDAEAQYKKALEKNASSKEGHFNLGDAYYRQDRHDEALKSFASAEAAAARKNDKSAALYNSGNALLKAGKTAESIEAYKQALRLNPADEEARYNLEYARKRQQQQQNQQQKQDKNQDKQKQDQKKDDQQQNQDQQNKQDQQQKQQPQPQQQKQQQIPPEQAEQILNALKNNEKAIQKELRKRAASRVRVEKDW